MKVYPLAVGQEAEVEINPAGKFDVGAGPGKPLTRKVKGGVVGLIFDGRGRPFTPPEDPAERVKANQRWLDAFGLPY